eukprot:403333048
MFELIINQYLIDHKVLFQESKIIDNDIFTISSFQTKQKSMKPNQTLSISDQSPWIRFPKTLGLTGLALTQNLIIYSNDVKHDNPFFNNNLDNLIEVKNIKHFVAFEIGLPSDETAQNTSSEYTKVGVIQLFNKINQDLINAEDMVSFINFIQSHILSVEYCQCASIIPCYSFRLNNYTQLYSKSDCKCDLRTKQNSGDFGYER